MKKSFNEFRVSLFSFFLAALAAPAFSQDLTSAVSTPLNKILAFFTSDAVRIILVIMIAASALAFAFNKDNEKMKRNCIAVGAAGVILLVSTEVVNLFWAK